MASLAPDCAAILSQLLQKDFSSKTEKARISELTANLWGFEPTQAFASHKKEVQEDASECADRGIQLERIERAFDEPEVNYRTKHSDKLMHAVGAQTLNQFIGI